MSKHAVLMTAQMPVGEIAKRVADLRSKDHF
jgi:hypothetical protein